MNKSQQYMELYAGLLPTVVDTQGSRGLVSLYNQFHHRPGVKIVEDEGGVSDEAKAYISQKRDAAYRRALRQAERKHVPPTRAKQLAKIAAKVAEDEAKAYIARMAARADADDGSKNEDAVSDFYKHYDKAGKKFDKRYNASHVEMTNYALGKVLKKIGAPDSALPPNVRFRANEEPNAAQQMTEAYVAAGYGTDEGYTTYLKKRDNKSCYPDDYFQTAHNNIVATEHERDKFINKLRKRKAKVRPYVTKENDKVYRPAQSDYPSKRARLADLRDHMKHNAAQARSYEEGYGVDERGGGSRDRRTKRRIAYLQYDLNRDYYDDAGDTEKDIHDQIKGFDRKTAKKVLSDMRKGIADKFTGGDVKKVPTQDKYRI